MQGCCALSTRADSRSSNAMGLVVRPPPRRHGHTLCRKASFVLAFRKDTDRLIDIAFGPQDARAQRSCGSEGASDAIGSVEHTEVERDLPEKPRRLLLLGRCDDGLGVALLSHQPRRGGTSRGTGDFPEQTAHRL